jgi:hypothetical protein
MALACGSREKGCKLDGQRCAGMRAGRAGRRGLAGGGAGSMHVSSQDALASRKGERDFVGRRQVGRRAGEGREAAVSEQEGKAGPRCESRVAEGGVGLVGRKHTLAFDGGARIS